MSNKVRLVCFKRLSRASDPFGSIGEQPIVRRTNSESGQHNRTCYWSATTMKWITRERVKVDRVACPWLIRNFVDPKAEFVFLPRDTDWKRIDNGIVFD